MLCSFTIFQTLGERSAPLLCRVPIIKQFLDSHNGAVEQSK
jgi:hypothetical protein